MLKWFNIHRYIQQVKCRPKNLVFNDISLIVIFAGIAPSEGVKVKRLPVASENYI